MKENKALKKITSKIKDYVISEIIISRKKDTELSTKAIMVMIMHESDTKRIAQELYEQKSSLTEATISQTLNNYVKLLLKDFDELDIEKLRGIKASELTGTTPKLSDIISSGWKIVLLTQAEGTMVAKYPTMAEYQSEIINNYKKLAQELNISTGLDLSHYFTKLLWNGYFSPTKEHSYQVRDRIVTYPTLEVFQGKGVCYNYAALQKEFLRACGKDARSVNCLASRRDIQPRKETKENPLTESEKKSRELRKSIERDAEISGQEKVLGGIIMTAVTPIAKKVGNHAITLITDGDKTFYYDPTNIFVLNPAGNKKAKIINGNGGYDIKQELSLDQGPTSRIEKLKASLMDMIVEDTAIETFTEEEVNETLEAIFNQIKENQRLVDDAYDSIKPTIIKLNEEIEKHKDELKVTLRKKK